MIENMKIENDKKDLLVKSIVEIEWGFFDKVNNTGGRAACQNDKWAFYVNRYSQFYPLSIPTLESYKRDLDIAVDEGRNLITEKYAYMMEFTDPLYFNQNLKNNIRKLSKEHEELAVSIADLMVEGEKKFVAEFPKFSSRGRKIEGNCDYASFRVYAIGELKTYSLQTLIFYFADIAKSHKENRSLSKEIHEMIAKFYGYESIEDAERKMK